MIKKYCDLADVTIAFERAGFDGAHYSAEVVHAIALARLQAKIPSHGLRKISS